MKMKMILVNFLVILAVLLGLAFVFSGCSTVSPNSPDAALPPCTAPSCDYIGPFPE